MKKITLLINGEEKTFTIPFVNGLAWRKYIKFLNEAADLSNLTYEEYDEYANILVLAFGNQFTLEEYLQGTDFRKVISTVDSLFLPPKSQKTEDNGKK